MLNALRKDRTPDCVSDVEFDEWTSGELSAEDAGRVEAHAVSCDRCSTRRDELALIARGFLEVAPRLNEAPRPRRFPWNSRGASLVAAACAAAFAVLVGLDVSTERAVRSKGGPHIGFYLKRGEQVTAGLDGQRVRRGDLLRFVVTTDRLQRLAVLSLDARGHVSVFSAARLAVDGIGPAISQPLETSVELDDSPGLEQVYAVFCDTQIDVEKLASTLETRHALETVDGCVVDRLNLVKDAP